MGVKGLKKFIQDECPAAYRQVSIAREVARYQRQTKRVPVLVVDGLAWMIHLYRHYHLDWIHGGQWAEYVDTLRKILYDFKRIGVHLVFYFDGSMDDTKRIVWAKRTKERKRRVKKIFEYVKQHHTQPRTMSLFNIPPQLSAFTYFALRYELEAEAYRSLGEADMEMCDYISRNEAWGVMSDDTDFYVYQCGVCLSLENFIPCTMRTVLFDRNVLCHSLCIQSYTLAIVASLAGNDILPEGSLRKWHSTIQKHFLSMIPAITAFVSSKLHPRISLQDSMRSLAETVFPDSTKARRLFQMSVETYLRSSVQEFSTKLCSLRDNGGGPVRTLPPPTVSDERLAEFPVPRVNPAVFREVEKQHVNCHSLDIVYNLLSGRPLDTGEYMEDDEDDLPQSSEMYRPVTQKLFGLLLGVGAHGTKADPSKVTNAPRLTVMPGSAVSGRPLVVNENAVREWIMYKGNPLQKPDLVEGFPVPMPKYTPSLCDLWFGAGDTIVDLRWRTFGACMLYPADDLDLRHLPPVHIIPVCVLHIMYCGCPTSQLQAFELDAFLITILSPWLRDVRALKRVRVSQVECRAVSLATLYVRGVAIALAVLTSCGSPFSVKHGLIWKSFDGRLFHHILQRVREEGVGPLLEHQAPLLQQYIHLKQMVTMETTADARIARSLDQRPRTLPPEMLESKRSEGGDGQHSISTCQPGLPMTGPPRRQYPRQQCDVRPKEYSTQVDKPYCDPRRPPNARPMMSSHSNAKDDTTRNRKIGDQGMKTMVSSARIRVEQKGSVQNEVHREVHREVQEKLTVAEKCKKKKADPQVVQRKTNVTKVDVHKKDKVDQHKTNVTKVDVLKKDKVDQHKTNVTKVDVLKNMKKDKVDQHKTNVTKVDVLKKDKVDQHKTNVTKVDVLKKDKVDQRKTNVTKFDVHKKDKVTMSKPDVLMNAFFPNCEDNVPVSIRTSNMQKVKNNQKNTDHNCQRNKVSTKESSKPVSPLECGRVCENQGGIRDREVSYKLSAYDILKGEKLKNTRETPENLNITHGEATTSSSDIKRSKRRRQRTARAARRKQEIAHSKNVDMELQRILVSSEKYDEVVGRAEAEHHLGLTSSVSRSPGDLSESTVPIVCPESSEEIAKRRRQAKVAKIAQRRKNKAEKKKWNSGAVPQLMTDVSSKNNRKKCCEVQEFNESANFDASSGQYKAVGLVMSSELSCEEGMRDKTGWLVGRKTIQNATGENPSTLNQRNTEEPGTGSRSVHAKHAVLDEAVDHPWDIERPGREPSLNQKEQCWNMMLDNQQGDTSVPKSLISCGHLDSCSSTVEEKDAEEILHQQLSESQQIKLVQASLQRVSQVGNGGHGQQQAVRPTLKQEKKEKRKKRKRNKKAQEHDEWRSPELQSAVTCHTTKGLDLLEDRTDPCGDPGARCPSPDDTWPGPGAYDGGQEAGSCKKIESWSDLERLKPRKAGLSKYVHQFKKTTWSYASDEFSEQQPSWLPPQPKYQNARSFKHIKKTEKRKKNKQQRKEKRTVSGASGNPPSKCLGTFEKQVGKAAKSDQANTGQGSIGPGGGTRDAQRGRQGHDDGGIASGEDGRRSTCSESTEHANTSRKQEQTYTKYVQGPDGVTAEIPTERRRDISGEKTNRTDNRKRDSTIIGNKTVPVREGGVQAIFNTRKPKVVSQMSVLTKGTDIDRTAPSHGGTGENLLQQNPPVAPQPSKPQQRVVNRGFINPSQSNRVQDSLSVRYGRPKESEPKLFMQVTGMKIHVSTSSDQRNHRCQFLASMETTMPCSYDGLGASRVRHGAVVGQDPRGQISREGHPTISKHREKKSCGSHSRISSTMLNLFEFPRRVTPAEDALDEPLTQNSQNAKEYQPIRKKKENKKKCYKKSAKPMPVKPVVPKAKRKRKFKTILPLYCKVMIRGKHGKSIRVKGRQFKGHLPRYSAHWRYWKYLDIVGEMDSDDMVLDWTKVTEGRLKYDPFSDTWIRKGHGNLEWEQREDPKFFWN